MSHRKAKTSVEAGVARIVLDDPATMNASGAEAFEKHPHPERLSRLAGRPADAGEGIAAFLEKRPARFIGA